MSVLRSLVVLLALALMATGGRLLVEGLRSPGLSLLAIGAILFGGTVFERWRYRRTACSPGCDWQRTDERFLDPQSGKSLTVYYDPTTGERHYVSEERPADRRSPSPWIRR